jgi:hypothetical protein
MAANQTNIHRQTGAVSLLTLAILLLLLGGTLMLGLNYFRSGQPSAEASREREALLWADKAVIGFASTHHRLPCPAAAPAGSEDFNAATGNCNRAKGWLPVSALNLDISGFAPGFLPIRYMVYLDDSLLVATRTETHRGLAHGDASVTFPGDARLRPYDAYEPGAWEYPTDDTRASPAPALIRDVTALKDTDTHYGRFTDRFDFDARNGLDMCETMRLVSVRQAKDGPSDAFAHYRRGGASVNVAYGLALPGRFDSDGVSNSPFDGANAVDATPIMEAPDKGHDANYDDYVFVRDFDSLMSAFACQPVAYTAQAKYADSFATGSGKNDQIDQFLNEQGKDADLSRINQDGILNVDIDRRGIVALMPESVQSVALSHGLITEVKDQYENLRDEAKQTMILASLEAAVAGLGAGVSGLAIAADGIAIGQASATAALCLGLCANQYVAIGLYTAAIVSSSVGLGLRIAATGVLIGAAAKASGIYGRMDGDPNDPDILAAQEEACRQIAKANEARRAAYQEELKEAKKARDDTYTKLLAARGRLNDYTSKLKIAVDACLDTLQKTGQDGLQCRNYKDNMLNNDLFACNSYAPPSACLNVADATYEKCFSGIATTVDTYENFQNPSSPILTLYATRLEKSVELAKLNGELEAEEQRANDTDPSTNADEIREMAIAVCQSSSSPGCVDSNIVTITAQYQENYLEAQANVVILTANRNTKANELTAAENAITAASTPLVENLPTPTPQCASGTSANPTATWRAEVRCDWHYAEACLDSPNNARDLIQRPVWKQFDYEDADSCKNDSENGKGDDCDRNAYNFLYDDHWYANELYEDAEARHQKLVTDGPPADISCTATSGATGTVQYWTEEEAVKVLRRVDKRSVLQ